MALGCGSGLRRNQGSLRTDFDNRRRSAPPPEARRCAVMPQQAPWAERMSLCCTRHASQRAARSMQRSCQPFRPVSARLMLQRRGASTRIQFLRIGPLLHVPMPFTSYQRGVIPLRISCYSPNIDLLCVTSLACLLQGDTGSLTSYTDRRGALTFSRDSCLAKACQRSADSSGGPLALQ